MKKYRRLTVCQNRNCTHSELNIEKILSQLLMTSKERDSMTFISSLLWNPFHFPPQLRSMKSLP